MVVTFVYDMSQQCQWCLCTVVYSSTSNNCSKFDVTPISISASQKRNMAHYSQPIWWHFAGPLQLCCLSRLNISIPCVCTFSYLSLSTIFTADNKWFLILTVVHHTQKKHVNTPENTQRSRKQMWDNETHVPTIISHVWAVVMIKVGLVQAYPNYKLK